MHNISEAQYKAKLEEYRRRLFRDPKVDLDTACGFFDWARVKLTDMEREKLQVEEMKKAALPGDLDVNNNKVLRNSIPNIGKVGKVVHNYA
ncbi:hypothetical protein [Paenibacillus sp. UNC451MF]|uniref:hypothetical protein n=1 Tax=Paenibacillus sp. UNC451MF TaxID=1449063 RepID=UPI00048F4281|nr:hypothetical protein [Paenibacillus sp. UNC451MF]